MTTQPAGGNILYVRMPDDLKRELRRAAQEADRSMSSLARILLGEALDARAARKAGPR